MGTPKAPVVVDVPEAEAFDEDRRILPAAVRRNHAAVKTWGSDFASISVAAVCRRGKKLSEGVAAWLRHYGAGAEVVDGGFEA